MPKTITNPQRKRKRIPLSAKKSNGPSPTETPVSAAPELLPVMPAELPQEVCRFRMLCQWPETATHRRKKKCYYNGNHFEKDPHKFLISLLRQLIKVHKQLFVAVVYDNTMPAENGQKVILKWYVDRITVNRLRNYSIMLKDFPLPEFLIPTAHNDSEG